MTKSLISIAASICCGMVSSTGVAVARPERRDEHAPPGAAPDMAAPAPGRRSFSPKGDKYDTGEFLAVK